MIRFSRDGNKVKIHVEHGIWGDGKYFDLEVVTSYDYQAELLMRQFENHRNVILEGIKRHYYNEGWRQAKGKKVRKRDWFPGNFNKT